ncbi:MAG TPA: hypothetical protein VMG11_09555 [Steroidobacteraceae bacterium]|nr:hypothetical protein [Steroidobacteraceae bacterium]
MLSAADDPAEITAPIIVALKHALGKRARSHELAVCGQVRSLWLLRSVGDVLPAAIGEQAMITARHKLGAIFQRSFVGRFDCAPMCKHTRLDIPPMRSDALRSVDLIADAQIKDRSRATVSREDQSLVTYTINARIAASAIRID